MGEAKTLGTIPVENGTILGPDPKVNCVDTEAFRLSATFAGTLSTSGFPSYPTSPRLNNEQTGIYYGQIFRNLGANLKYPLNKKETIYQSTGHLRILKEGENGSIVESVFGVDVYNQKTHFQLRIPQYLSTSQGFGAGISFYSQNVVNSQMFEVL